MQRGELYLVRNPAASRDPKKQRVLVIVSRQFLVDSRFSTVICAPVYSRYDEFSTQVRVGIQAGLKHESSIHCDELFSVPKALLTRFIGKLSQENLSELNRALAAALALDTSVPDSRLM